MTIHETRLGRDEFSDIWNHDRHFTFLPTVCKAKLWDNLILREFHEGCYTNRAILCAITHLVKSDAALNVNYVACGVSILHTTSEYANHYGNSNVTYNPGDKTCVVKKVV